MRNKENCTRGFIPDLQQKLLHVTAGLGVESAERLVEKEDRRLVGERSGKRHALELAARQLYRHPVSETPKPDDAADALAVAICHLHSSRMAMLSQAGDE